MMTGSSDKHALLAANLSVNLGGRRILRNVDLTVEPGSIHGLLGPNGAGKTTLLRAAMGLIPVATGRCQLGRGAGYVPQRHDVKWDFPITVEHVVMTGMVRRIGYLRRPRTAHVKAVARALHRVNMAHMRNRPIGELSGGQRQRVLIARALASDPGILLLDEPFTGLDMPTQELLTELFKRLAREGTALLLTTHDITHAMVVCDWITMLNGSVTASATPQQLREPDPWMRTFKVSVGSPLLHQVGAVSC